MMRPAVIVALTHEERRRLREWRDSPETPPRLARRAHIVLEAARGRTNRSIAVELAVDPETVALWRRRFSVNRLDGIRWDAPRSGRRTALPADLIERISRVPPKGLRTDGSRWTTRQLAHSLGVSHMRVHRAWQVRRPGAVGSPAPGAHSPSLRRVRRVDVAGVYLSPPSRAIVFTVDAFFEPNVPGATIVEPPASPDPADGSPAGWGGLLSALDRWRYESAPGSRGAQSTQDLLVFLRTIDGSMPATTELHVILDEFSVEATRRIERWMKARPRFHRYRVPSGSTWTQAVDRWWRRWPADEQRDPGRRHVEQCVESLVHFLGRQNPALSPFAWTPRFPSPAEREAAR